jgi:hypothetical protein
MVRFTRNVLIIAFSAAAPFLSAATPAIGIAMSSGSIMVNSGWTAGNATIFDGSTVQTRESASQVRLTDGAQVLFATESRGKLFTDHVDLEKGSARISGFAANAAGLNVRTEGNGSANISMQGKEVQIAALTGNVQVFNAKGMNVANLLPGRALSLRPDDAGASAPSSITGCAVKSKNNILLTDETSNVTLQLRGGAIKTGRRIQITGSMIPNATPATGATQVIDVTNVKDIGGVCGAAGKLAAGGAAGAAAGGAAGGAAGAAAGAAGAAAGISTTTAVIAGVGAAAAVGTGVGFAAKGNSRPSLSGCTGGHDLSPCKP